MKDKPFLTSKTIWAGLIIAIVGVLQAFNVPLPYIEMIYSLAGAFGLYGIRDAIGKNK